jgi:hypothetical protein
MKRGSIPDFCQVRDCSLKFITSCQYFNRRRLEETIENESAVELGIDEVACILSFLPLTVIVCLRCVNMTWRDAARKTIVPPTNFLVNSVTDYNAMRVMTTELPNLQQIAIGGLERGHKYNDGEDPDEDYAARSAHLATHDIGIISNFSKLRILKISDIAGLNGRYPFLFNSFPLLQKLSIIDCPYVKWDLHMLSGMPLLKELECYYSDGVSGNINSLRVLKGTLETVYINCCCNVEGNIMDLADFPRLKELNLYGSAVTGDIRDIGNNDFSSLEDLDLPRGVYGGAGCEFQRISDAPDLIRSVYLLKKQCPALVQMEDWYGKLSEDSPDWYERADEDDGAPPFYICFVEAGSRTGYRWETGSMTNHKRPCEVNWLDPEPERGSICYEDYVADCRSMQDEIGMYRGYYEPPTEEQYTLLCEEHLAEIQRDGEDH